MQPTQHSRPHTTRPNIRPASRLAALTLILAAAALNAGCPGNNPDSHNMDNKPTPSPTSEVTAPATDATDDRPIVISGGSLNIYFNHQGYIASPGSSGSNKKFRLNNHKITAMRVYNDETGENSSPICEPTFAGNSSIVVGYKIGAATKQLTIKSAPDPSTGRPTVEVEFDISPAALGLRPGSQNMHYSRTASLDSVSYIDGTSPQASCAPIPASHKISIEIDDKYQKP